MTLLILNIMHLGFLCPLISLANDLFYGSFQRLLLLILFQVITFSVRPHPHPQLPNLLNRMFSLFKRFKAVKFPPKNSFAHSPLDNVIYPLSLIPKSD